MQNAQEYWNGKHPKLNELFYKGRFVPKSDLQISTNVTHFIRPICPELQACIQNEIFEALVPSLNNSLDQMAGKIQRWVCTGIRKAGDRKGKRVLQYVYDSQSFGHSEFWQYTDETLALGTGDCEDGAILIASLLLNAGIPSWRVRVAAGWVRPSPTAPEGGHGYCCYCREKDNQWVVLDWCFYEDSSIIVVEKPLLKDKQEYRKTWFSFNNELIWSHEDFVMEGRSKDYEAPDNA
jgi:hypothetical protein